MDIVLDGGAVTCEQGSTGQADNEHPLIHDTLTPSELFPTVCVRTFGAPGPRYSVTDEFKALTLSWNGQVRTRGTARISTPGPCVYQFRGLAMEMSIPGNTGEASEGPYEASPMRRQSNLDCAQIVTGRWLVEMFSGVTFESFGTELRG